MDRGGIRMYSLEEETGPVILKTISGHGSGFNDFEWYPWMSKAREGSELIITVSKDAPVQMWDTLTAELRCSWSARDHLDQVATCYSATFSPSGSKIVTGGDGRLWIFDVYRPGQTDASNPISTLPKRKSTNGVGGIVSCINFRYDDSGLFGFGSFKGKIGLYDIRMLESSSETFSNPITDFFAHSGGVSQIKFLNDGWSIVSAGRKGSKLHKWDLRRLSEGNTNPVATFETKYPACNQRIYFDIYKERFLLTGDGNSMSCFDLSNGEIIPLDGLKYNDVISSVSIRPNHDNGICFSEGSRQFFVEDDESRERIGSAKIHFSRLDL